MEQLGDLLKLLASGRLPRELPTESPCTQELGALVEYLREIAQFVRAISSGDLTAKLEAQGPLAGSLKALQANLRHLTWQTQQVAAEDFSQRVEFLGEFSDAFNSMVEKLAEGRNSLIEKNNELSSAYEELQRTQLQLLQQKTMASVGQLAAGVAHEINNPIGFIASNLRTMEKYIARLKAYITLLESALSVRVSNASADALSAERKRMKIDFLLEDGLSLLVESADGAARIETIVRDLKTFTQLDAAEWQLADINDCLESALSIAANHLSADIEIHKVYAELPDTLCQLSQLNQVFFNLLINAGQAIEGQGKIRVSTALEDDNIVVRIEDTGAGIAKELQEKIFEPFFTTKEVGSGTGLGLAVAYDIIKNHDGSIELESTPGVGTCFTIKLPPKAA